MSILCRLRGHEKDNGKAFGIRPFCVTCARKRGSKAVRLI